MLGQTSAAWERQAALSAGYVDALGRGMDAGIIEAVTALRLLGFVTTGSCQGHLDHGLPGPWVDIALGKLTRYRLGGLLDGFYVEHRPADAAARLTLTNIYDTSATRLVELRLCGRATRDHDDEVDGDRRAVLALATAEMAAFTGFLRARL